MSVLHVRNIDFAFGPTSILNDISFNIQQGELVSVLGPNGCGKTTLLKLLLGLYTPQKGNILLDGVDISTIDKKQLARKLAYVPQMHNASFAYKVREVVLMGRMPHKSLFSPYSRNDERMAMTALKKVGIAHLAEKPYTRISGGERQLTLIARALTQGSSVFVLDEPLNGLDYGNQIKLLEQLHELCREGFTFIKSTHFPDHALWVADHVIMLKNGHVHADGAPEEVITHENLLEIYGAQVLVTPFEQNFRICIPEKIRSRLCRSPLQAVHCPASGKPSTPAC